MKGGPVLKLWTDGGTYEEERHPERPGAWAYIAELFTPGRGNRILHRASGAEVWAETSRMELLAVAEGLRFAHLRAPDLQTWVIADDRRIINGSSGGPRLDRDARLWADVDALVELREAPTIFHWVKGHAGATHNEAADRMVRRSRGRLVEQLKDARRLGAYL